MTTPPTTDDFGVEMEQKDSEAAAKVDEQPVIRATDDAGVGDSRNCDLQQDNSFLQMSDVQHHGDELRPAFVNTMMPTTARKDHSENLTSRIVTSSARHSSPRFLDGSLPSYALPTVASQIRISLTAVAAKDLPVCHKYKTPSPICSHRRRRRSRSVDNGLESDFLPKQERCSSARLWKSSSTQSEPRKASAATKRSTPTQPSSVNGNRTAASDSRPSSARTDSSIHNMPARNLFDTDKVGSQQRKNKGQSRPTAVSKSGTETDGGSCDKNRAEKEKLVGQAESGDCKENLSHDTPDTKTTKSGSKSSARLSSEKAAFVKKQNVQKRNSEVESVVAKQTKEGHVVKKTESIRTTRSSKRPSLTLTRENSSASDKTPDCPVSTVETKSTENADADANEKKNSKLVREKSITEGENKVKTIGLEKTGDVSVSIGKPSPRNGASNKNSSFTAESGGKPSSSARSKSTVEAKKPTVKVDVGKEVPEKKETRKSLPPGKASTSLAGSKDSTAKSTNKESNRKTLDTSVLGDEKSKEHVKSPGPTDVVGAAKESGGAMEEYRTKLAEKRKLAREKAEREAEEERLKNEQLRISEEQRKQREEEEERKREEEELRLMEECRRLEEERYQKLVEEAELQRKQEAERIEAEAKAKMEQEILAKEEAERLEKERLDRKKREDEEKLERKKRLEKIMKRVKNEEQPAKGEISNASDVVTVSQADTVEPSSHVVTVSQADTVEPSSQSTHSTSPNNNAELLDSSADEGTARFKSPLLQQLITGKAKTQTVVSTFLNADEQSVNCIASEAVFGESIKLDDANQLVLSQELIG